MAGTYAARSVIVTLLEAVSPGVVAGAMCPPQHDAGQCLTLQVPSLHQGLDDGGDPRRPWNKEMGQQWRQPPLSAEPLVAKKEASRVVEKDMQGSRGRA